MIQMTQQELDDMVSQNAIPSKQVLGGDLPYAVTEHGILMLSNPTVRVFSSERRRSDERSVGSSSRYLAALDKTLGVRCAR